MSVGGMKKQYNKLTQVRVKMIADNCRMVSGEIDICFMFVVHD